MSKYTLRVFKTDLAGLFRCFVHPETLDRMDDIIEGDYVLIKGNKRTETVLQIKVNEDVPRNCIGMKITTLSNLFVENHTEIVMYPCHNIKKARKIEVQACQSKKHQEPEIKKIIVDFFSKIGTDRKSVV
jgi:formylmethanofuran dehydrogenase subunit D